MLLSFVRTTNIEEIKEMSKPDDLLIEYSQTGDVKAAESLILEYKDNIDVNHACKRYGYTALIYAIQQQRIQDYYHNSPECVELLLKHPNINVNHANNCGESALIIASAKGETECLELLLKHPNIDPLQPYIYDTCYFDLL